MSVDKKCKQVEPECVCNELWVEKQAVNQDLAHVGL